MPVAVTATAAAVVCAMALPAVAAAGLPFAPPPGHSLRNVVLHAATVTPRSEGSAISVRLRGVDPTAVVTTSASPAGQRVRGIGALSRTWTSTLGFSPTVAMTYRMGGVLRTHVLRGGRLPSYTGRDRTLRVQFDGTSQNRAVLSRMRRSGATEVRVRLLPTPAASGPFVPGAYDPGVPKAQAQAPAVPDTAVTPYPAPGPNRTFTLPYMAALQASDGSWNNYLSGTGETTPTCQVATPSGVGGDPSNAGMLFVYDTAAEAQQALNIGGSIGYTHGLAKASLSVAYSSLDTQSSSSLYAIAIANYKGGTVNLDSPQLTGTNLATANGITGINGALSFMSQCGDSYPVSYGVGASWVSVLQIQFASESEAASVSEKLKVSYAGIGATTGFTQDLEDATSSSTSIVSADQCWGISSCSQVPGYAPVTTTNIDSALAQVNANYAAMLSGLPSACASPGGSPPQCVTAVTYKPIAGLPQQLAASQALQQASYGAFGVQQNLNAWNSEYQALVTGTPGSSSIPVWQQSSGNLTTQALSCDIAGLTQSACAQRVQACWNSSQQTYSYLNAPCEPSAFSGNGLKGLPDPFGIADQPEENLAS